MTLRDGRTLAWHEWGVPDGIPILRLQGTPGSRFARHPIWERLGVRVIMADRPGFGASTRMPGRGLASVADDLVELLDHLGLDRVPVTGQSGGGAHVLALGARHPARISAATVIAGGAPLTDADIPLLIGYNAEAHRRFDDGGQEALYQLLRDYREKALADPLADIRTSMHDAPPEDQAVLSDPTFQQILRQDRTEALRQGAEGWCDECLAASDWDIAPEAVTVHVVWYHSRHDANEPLQAVQRLADRLPSVELRLWEGGHLEAFHRQEELIRDLLTRAELR
ncbi:alpha/beta fold hydrolase [Polymorphospora rubra]|uniref:alpha/beta fold hydrolase n=1 Tax=Polymorphospora rubra TaxID=338584 RepID=UPI001BB37961|nr:alpha/beta hydrolase [Polymorphospora rubra]